MTTFGGRSAAPAPPTATTSANSPASACTFIAAPSLRQEPGPGRRIGLEEAQQLVGDLLLARARRVGAALAEVVDLVEQAVAVLGRAAGPDVRPPAQPRRDRLALRRVKVQLLVALDLAGDQPLHREAGLVGERLRVEFRRRVAAVGAAGEIDELQ